MHTKNICLQSTSLSLTAGVLDSETLLLWDDVWKAIQNQKVDPQQPRQPQGGGFSWSCLAWEVLGHLDRGSQSRTDKEREIEEMSLFWVLKQPPSTGRAILGLEVRILCRGGDGGSGARLWWKGACGTGRLCQWAAHMALLSQPWQVLGQGDKRQCSLPAMQLPTVLWHGPEGLLLLLTQVPQKISRKSYLKWKQSLQPGGMPCGEVSRPWLSQETICQFGI